MSDASDIDEFYDALVTDFTTFAMRAFMDLIDDEAWVAPNYFQVFGDVGQRLAVGDKRRIILNAPPRCGKSQIMSVAYPLWRLIREPKLQVMVISYGDRLNAEHLITLRKILDASWFKRFFSAFESIAKVTQKGLLLATGGKINFTTVDGAVTGLGGDLIILDDLAKANEALQPAPRVRLEHWLQSTLMTRLDDPRTGSFLLCMQRLHIEDITACLLERGTWHHVTLPLVAQKDLNYSLLSGSTIERQKGDVLEAQRFPDEKIRELKLDLGKGFEAQYQQEPLAGDGGVINVDDFQYFDEPPENVSLCCSVDAAAEPGRGNDFSVFQVWGMYGDNYYLLHQERQQLDFKALIAAYEALQKRWGFHSALIETGGNGRALFQSLRDRPSPVDVTPITPKDNKQSRAYRCVNLIAMGYVFLPKNASWLGAFIREFRLFPNGKHDDQVDATTQYLNYQLNQPKGIPVAPITVTGDD